MAKRQYLGSRTVLVSSWFALLGYGCVADPATTDDGGGDAASGTGGSGVSGASTGGVSGAVTGGAPTGGVSGAVTGGAPTGGVSGSATGGAVPTGGANPGGAGVGTSGNAGTGTSGTAGTPTGGTGAGTGPGGAGPQGGSGPAGGSGGANTDAECKSITSKAACPIEGKVCPNLACGLGDTGRRTCNCATTWTCESCNFAGSAIATKPANAETACVGVTEGMMCATSPGLPESVCKSTVVTTEYCMCATDPRNPTAMPEWDCDKPPSTWM